MKKQLIELDELEPGFISIKELAGSKESQEDIDNAFCDICNVLIKSGLTQLGMIVTLTLIDQVRKELQADYEKDPR